MGTSCRLVSCRFRYSRFTKPPSSLGIPVSVCAMSLSESRVRLFICSISGGIVSTRLPLMFSSRSEPLSFVASLPGNLTM